MVLLPVTLWWFFLFDHSNSSSHSSSYDRSQCALSLLSHFRGSPCTERVKEDRREGGRREVRVGTLIASQKHLKISSNVYDCDIGYIATCPKLIVKWQQITWQQQINRRSHLLQYTIAANHHRSLLNNKDQSL